MPVANVEVAGGKGFDGWIETAHADLVTGDAI